MKRFERMIEDREKRERKNVIMKGLKGKGKKNLMESAQKIVEEEFEEKEGVEDMQIAEGEGREIIIRIDSWERKEEIMRRNKELDSRKIYIDNDLSQKEREVQRKSRKVARHKRAGGRRARVGYMRIEIVDQIYIRSEEENRIVRSRNF